MTTDQFPVPADLFDATEALLDRRAYSDAEIYELEADRLFGHCWLAIGHESQVREPGDFFTGSMADDPVLLWRGIDGQLRAFINACTLSAQKLCFAEDGNAGGIACRCHGLTYDFDGGSQDEKVHLAAVARLQSYAGLIFASYGDDVPTLEEYLGDFSYYLDLLLAGKRVIGGSLKGKVAANWKLPMDAHAGGLFNEAASNPGSAPPPELGGLLQISAGPGSLLASWEDGRLETLRGALFPNLAFSSAESGFHIFNPRGPRETEVWSFCLVSPEQPFEERERARLAFQRRYSVSSISFEDMAGHWEEITRLSAGFEGRQHPVHLRAGLGQERYHEELPGIVGDASSEMNQRAFYQRWRQMLGGERNKSAR